MVAHVPVLTTDGWKYSRSHYRRVAPTRGRPANLSTFAASFYAETKRVSNRKAKALLGFAPAYPTYREGLQALWAAGEGRPMRGR